MSEAEPTDFLSAPPGTEAEVADALIAAGRADDLVKLLLRELTGDSTWAREQALQRLAVLRDYEPFLEPLRAALADDDDAERRNAARSILANLASPGAGNPDLALRALRDLMEPDQPADVRLLAASALGESGNPAARPLLEDDLNDPETNVVAAVVDALGILGDSRALSALIPIAEGGDFWTRVAAVVSLGRLGDEGAVPTLISALREPWLASAAAVSLGEIGDSRALEPLREVVEQGGGGRDEALDAAATIVMATGDRAVPDWLRQALRERESALAERFGDGELEAGRLLGIAGSDRAAGLLVRALGDPGQQDAAAAGVTFLPPSVAATSILEALKSADRETAVLLLGSLPALTEAASIQSVTRFLADPDAELRAAAAEVLGRSDEDLVLDALTEAITDPAAQHGVALTYARLGSARCDPLAQLLLEGSPAVRAAAAEGLAHCGDLHVELLRRSIREEVDGEVQHALIRALGVSGTAEAVEELVPLLSDSDAEIRFAAAQALGRSRREEAFAPLAAALDDDRPEVRAAVLSALGEMGDPRAGEPLTRHLTAEDRDLRRTAIFALDRLNDAELGERIIDSLRDPDLEVRLTAVRVLHRLGWDRGGIALEKVADLDPDALVRQAAGRAVREMRTSAGEERG